MRTWLTSCMQTRSATMCTTARTERTIPRLFTEIRQCWPYKSTTTRKVWVITECVYLLTTLITVHFLIFALQFVFIMHRKHNLIDYYEVLYALLQLSYLPESNVINLIKCCFKKSIVIFNQSRLIISPPIYNHTASFVFVFAGPMFLYFASQAVHDPFADCSAYSRYDGGIPSSGDYVDAEMYEKVLRCGWFYYVTLFYWVYSLLGHILYKFCFFDK